MPSLMLFVSSESFRCVLDVAAEACVEPGIMRGRAAGEAIGSPTIPVRAGHTCCKDGGDSIGADHVNAE